MKDKSISLTLVYINLSMNHFTGVFASSQSCSHYLSDLIGISRSYPKHLQNDESDDEVSISDTSSSIDSTSTSTSASDFSCRKGQRRKQRLQSINSKQSIFPCGPTQERIESPYEFWTTLIDQQGYVCRRYDSLRFYNRKPTEVDEASYHTNILTILQRSDGEELNRLLEAGISPNACNLSGETLAHKICRNGYNPKMLRILIEHGCCLKVADNFGRTLLHNICWNSSENAFGLFDAIIEADRTNIDMFYMSDSRGVLPLETVPEPYRVTWNRFIEQQKDSYWPPTYSTVCHIQESVDTKDERNDEFFSLSPELAAMLSSGKMKTEEIRRFQHDLPFCLHEDDEDDEDDFDCMNRFDESENLQCNSFASDAIEIIDADDFNEMHDQSDSNYSFENSDFEDILNGLNQNTSLFEQQYSAAYSKFVIPVG